MSGPLDAGATGSCELPWVLGTEVRSSGQAALLSTAQPPLQLVKLFLTIHFDFVIVDTQKFDFYQKPVLPLRMGYRRQNSVYRISKFLFISDARSHYVALPVLVLCM